MRLPMADASSAADLSIYHLRLEFDRLDILLHRQIERRQARAVAESSSYHLSDEQAYALLELPFAHASPPLPAETAYDAALAAARTRLADCIEEARRQGARLRFAELCALLELDAFERDALLICLAPALDLRYAELYAYLQNDLTRKWPSIDLILDLLGPPGTERLLELRHFVAASPLWKRQLIVPLTPTGSAPLIGLGQTLRPDEGIVAWLTLGEYQPPASLAAYLSLLPAPQPDTLLLTAERRAQIAAAAAVDALVVMDGVDTGEQHHAARALAFERRQPLLTLDLAGITPGGRSLREALHLVLRDALLIGATPYFTGWDHCLVDDVTPPELLALLADYPGCALLGGRQSWRPSLLPTSRRSFRLSFPGPNHRQREHLLRHLLAATDSARGVVDSLDLTTLARQFDLTSQQIQDTIGMALDLALQERQLLQNRHLWAAARAHSSPRLSTLATRVVSGYNWDNLILSTDRVAILRELADMVRYRALVLDEWGVGEKLAPSRGIIALFAGPPGTGKTMAAGVIANELGLDLYRIDLSSVVSKYIGETEKNLERIFGEADRSNIILFFDEADALFGKRSDVKDARDRYANIEISYLLQRMESYNGITILATNLVSNLDEAFTRRLHAKITFAEPDADQRLRIWRSLLPPGVPVEPDINWSRLAQRFALSGGNIRNVIVLAAYLAAREQRALGMTHLLHATRREFQKMGRMLNERDFAE